MNPKITRTLCILIGALALLAQPGPAAAQAEVEGLNSHLPVSILYTAADYSCLDENILVEGTFHIVERAVLTAAGGRNIKVSFNSPGFSGIGDRSGSVYQVTGPDHFSFTDQDATNPPHDVTFLDVVNIVGRGGAQNIQAWTLFHLTWNAAGQITANVAGSRMECR